MIVMKLLALYFAGLCALATLSACGSSGARGPAGPPADRSKLYCNTDGGSLDESHLTLTAYCNSKADLPWSGSCGGTIPQGVYLEQDVPVSWEDASVPAGWKCTWAPYGAMPQGGSGVAEVCCYDMSGT